MRSMATAPAAKPTKAEYDFRLRLRRYDLVTSVVLQLITWSAIVLIARYGYYAVFSLAGHATLTDIAVRFLSNVKVSSGISYIVGAAGMIYGAGQHRARHRNIKRMANDKNELEKIIDAKRSSSNLTEEGNTRPGDEL